MDNCPYDNVEFPVRPTEGVGTWTDYQPNQHKFYNQTVVRDKKTSSLSPVQEAEGFPMIDDIEVPDVEEQRKTTKTTSAVTTMATTVDKVDTVVNMNKGMYVVSAKQQNNVLPEPTVKTTPKSSTLPVNLTSHEAKPIIVEQPRSIATMFTRSDFNPESQDLLDIAYKRHNSQFQRLNERLLKQANFMKEEIWDVTSKTGETLSYEQLLQGMLEEGEILVLGGSWLYFSNLYFLDAEKETNMKTPLGRGRLCLTNKKLLILSAENVQDANLEEFGDSKTKEGGYKLNVSKFNSIYFQNLPLGCFHSVELESGVGTCQQSRLTKRPPICCGLCSCFGVGCCTTRWKASDPLEVPIHRRIVRISASLPPLGRQAQLVVHLNPEMSLAFARDFIAQLHRHAPLLH